MRRLTALAALLAIVAVGVASNAVAQAPKSTAPPAKSADKAKHDDKKAADKDAKKDTKKDEAAQPAGKLLAVGSAAPEWTLKDAAGKEHKLSEFKGKVVVMDFWATWCGPCKKAMPSVQKVHEKFKDKGVVVIGISTWEKDGDPAAFMKDKGFTYNLYLKGDDVAKTYKVEGIPTFYVIGGDGKIAFCESGFDPSDETKLEKIVEKQLASGKM